MRISDWSSDVCSSDLRHRHRRRRPARHLLLLPRCALPLGGALHGRLGGASQDLRASRPYPADRGRPHPGPHGHRHDDRTALGLLLLAARRLPGAGENRMTPRLVGDEFHRNEEEVATIYGISMSYAGAGASWLSLRHWEWSARDRKSTRLNSSH